MSVKAKLKSNKFKWIMSVVAIVLSISACIGVFLGINNLRDTKEMSTSCYHVGTVDDSGKVVDSRKAIYSDIKTTEDMKIELEDDATITYKVVFYDENEDYISSSEVLETNYDNTTTPANAEYFRVVITPYQVDGEDVTLNAISMLKYTNMINISYANN